MVAETPRDVVFLSYSHTNPTWRDRLLVLLKPFTRQGRLQVWADPYIQAGAIWRREIDNAIVRARLGVVLLTPDLLASDFIADVELPALLKAAKAHVLRLLIVPIEAHATGATRFEDGDLINFQWAWDPKKPLAHLSRPNWTRALVTVTDAIVKAADSNPTDEDENLESVRAEHTPTIRGERAGQLFGVPPLPPNYLQWDSALKPLKEALLGMSPVVGVSANRGSMGVHGQGGLGKTVVAQAMANDEQVRRSFPDGIFWVTLGEQPRLESLQATLAAWSGEPVAIEDVLSGRQLLQGRLRDKACLVILDDVWQLGHAMAFDVLGERSRILVTTRDRTILSALGARDMQLDAFPLSLALELLAQWAGIPISELPLEANEIVKEVDHLPLALSLAGAQIRDGASWSDLLAALRKGSLTYLDHPYGSIFASIQASVNALDPEDAARYLELAVFPEDVAVPVSIVEQLWSATSHKDSMELRGVIRRLAARGLLRLTRNASENQANSSSYLEPAISLHDLQHDFMRLQVADLAMLHGRMVDVWRSDLRAEDRGEVKNRSNWPSLPLLPLYRWQFLAYHLFPVARDELRSLLLDVEWMQSKIGVTDVHALMADYQLFPRDRTLKCIQRCLSLCADTLNKWPQQLPAQLAGRLRGNSPDMTAFINQLRTTVKATQFIPTQPTLREPEEGIVTSWRVTPSEGPVKVFISRNDQTLLLVADDKVERHELLTGRLVESQHVFEREAQARSAQAQSLDMRGLFDWKTATDEAIPAGEPYRTKLRASRRDWVLSAATVRVRVECKVTWRRITHSWYPIASGIWFKYECEQTVTIATRDTEVILEPNLVPNVCTAIGLSEDGCGLTLANKDGDIIVLDLTPCVAAIRTGGQVAPAVAWRGSTGTPILSIAINVLRSRIATLDVYGQILVTEVSAPYLRSLRPANLHMRLEWLVVGSSGRFAIAVGEDDRWSLWNIMTGEKVAETQEDSMGVERVTALVTSDYKWAVLREITTDRYDGFLVSVLNLDEGIVTFRDETPGPKDNDSYRTLPTRGLAQDSEIYFASGDLTMCINANRGTPVSELPATSGGAEEVPLLSFPSEQANITNAALFSVSKDGYSLCLRSDEDDQVVAFTCDEPISAAAASTDGSAVVLGTTSGQLHFLVRAT